ncbi:MAG TPA: metalloregulator ArsR/SmtB family transcription factor [Armatimonadaceae bacterium]|nr:metalloregulator ArsR/SmtB family transcription factor [Armatimonadaceae bacterium]
MNTLSYEIESATAADLGDETCETRAVHEDVVAALRPSNVTANEAYRLAEVFAALSDPTRVRMVDALARTEELCVCDLCELLGLKQSNVSHQLRLLRSLRLVKNRRAGRNVYYSLDDDHVRDLLRQGLDHVREDAHLSREIR